jgi:hypothetical protein
MISQQTLPDERKSLNAQTLQAPLRWPLVVQPENRNQTTTFDAKLVNGYAERDDKGYQVKKRPGLSAPVYTGLGVAGGIFNWVIMSPGSSSQLLWVLSGGNLYLQNYYPAVGPPTFTLYGSPVFNYGPTLVHFGHFGLNSGVLLYSNIVQWCIVPNGVTPWLVFGTGSATYSVFGLNAGGALTQITDPNFPAVCCPGIVYLDGTTYVMDFSGVVWGSAGLGNPMVWSALNFIAAGTYGDGGVYLAQQLTYVIAIKQWSTQVFFDAGNATGSPLSPLPGALTNYGCLSPDTVQSIEGLLIWVTTNRTASPQVGIMDNLQFRIVSSPAVDRLLANGSVNGINTHFYSTAFKKGGHRFYSVTIYEANLTLVFDIDQGLWYQWTDANGNYWPMVANSFDNNNNLLFQHINNGNTYILGMDYTYPSDNGTVFPVDIYTPNFDAGVDRQKYLSQMRFNADQTDGSTLYVRNSDDDYQTWTNFRRVDLSQVRPIMNDCGTFYRRAYHIRHSANTALRIKSLDLQMDLGTL